MSDNKTIDNVHVEIYGHEMLSELITRARKNNIPYDKEMQYDFHSHGHSYLVLKDGELTLLEDPLPKHNVEVSLNDLFELYLSKEEVKKELDIGKWYKTPQGGLYCVVSIEDKFYNAYGFSVSGYWFENEGIPKGVVGYDRPATSQEVEQALIEEAKRLGFKDKFIAYNSASNVLCGDGERILLDSTGHWSNIIEQPEEKPMVGDVCKFWDNNENDFFIAKLHSISDGEFPYTVYQGYSDFMNAKTLTQTEAIELLFGKENVDD
ncbi:hypothetical protein ACS126_01645 [Sphingobacterium lactis]|uniref:hypothetical protein n=1 Tax=Sphingobacterium lactis TaxID=797291 RepID=UPI003EC5ABE8